MWRIDLKQCLKVVRSKVGSETGRMVKKCMSQDV